MRADIKEIHNITRPGQPPTAGDVIEIECFNGFIKAVDPLTRTTTDRHQRFTYGQGGGVVPFKSTVRVSLDPRRV
jgi:hypothetical protein